MVLQAWGSSAANG